MLFRDGEIKRQQDGRGGVDGHRGGNAVERNGIEERLHILERVNGHAGAPHLAPRQGMVGVEADLSGEVEGNGKAGLALS